MNVIHLHVQRMHNAIMVNVLACLACKVIHTFSASTSVISTAIVQMTKLAFETNAPTLVKLRTVHRTQIVRCITIYQCALVHQEWMEMHSFNVAQSFNKLISLNIMVVDRLHVETLPSAEK